MTEPKRQKLSQATVTAILSDGLINEIPLIEVFIATIIDPKTISKLIIQLNTVLPIPELLHLKRVKGRQILLFPQSLLNGDEEKVLPLLQEKSIDITLIEDKITKGLVAKIPPKVRRQHQHVHKLWPCNFHSNPYLEKLSTNTLFTDVELAIHAKFMHIALDICEFAGVKSGVAVVDPLQNTLVAIGYDQSGHSPIKHAIMVAIDNVAKTQNGGAWENSIFDRKCLELLKSKYENDLEFGFSHNEDNPYLCTGYVVYTTVEPCIMCAMALVHSRIKRVFYRKKSVKGALGSLCKIHVVENLNHHYEAWCLTFGR